MWVLKWLFFFLVALFHVFVFLSYLVDYDEYLVARSKEELKEVSFKGGVK